MRSLQAWGSTFQKGYRPLSSSIDDYSFYDILVFGPVYDRRDLCFPRAQPLPRLYECNLCGKTFNNRRRDRFLAHLRLHTGDT